MSFEEIKSEIAKLSYEQRHLFIEYALSLDSEDEESELSDEFKAELDKRVNDLDNGKIRALTLEEFHKETFAKYDL